MSNPAVPVPRRERFVLQAHPPLKSYFLASLYTLSGAILLVLALRGAWANGFVVFGWVLIGLGTVLAAAALLVHSQLQTTLLLEAETLTLVNPLRKRVLRWSDIEEVGLSGPRLVFVGKDARRRVVFFNPRQVNEQLFGDMVDTLRRRLDTNRGYSQFTPG